ncbi:MAG: mannonate dehydratase, partial [Marinosulfonomonas sp.]|nr:mannonate dehydratase [Marinosulfonomonas sp.]
AAMSDSPANGFTFCTGSIGAHPENDPVTMLERFGDRVYFLHLRSTRREKNPLSFHESGHLTGDVDIVQIARIALKVSRKSGALPYRPDHGHALLDDQSSASAPGYPLIGRMRGLAELRGLFLGIGGDWACHGQVPRL